MFFSFGVGVAEEYTAAAPVMLGTIYMLVEVWEGISDLQSPWPP